MEKSKCSIPTCLKIAFCKGYCRNHYNSFTRHGDPLHAERFIAQRRLKSEEKEKSNANKTKREKNVGKTCKMDDCPKPARIKGYCLQHDARLKRNNTLVPKIKRSNIQVASCLVLGCTSKPKYHGICAHHLNNIKELKTPLKPTLTKLCGVTGCEKKHMAKGMCSTHYAQRKAVISDYNLKPKITQFCGVTSCEREHMAEGMCSTHYAQWKAVISDYKLSEFVSLNGFENNG